MYCSPSVLHVDHILHDCIMHYDIQNFLLSFPFFIGPSYLFISFSETSSETSCFILGNSSVFRRCHLIRPGSRP